MSFQRRLGADRVVVGINYGTSAAALAVPGLPAGATLRSLFPAAAGDIVVGADQRANISLAGQSLRVFASP
jgi:hypothetical protein